MFSPCQWRWNLGLEWHFWGSLSFVGKICRVSSWVILGAWPDFGNAAGNVYIHRVQGLCVATLFCFFNGEVIAQVKRKWRTIFYSSRPRSNSYTATQVSVSIDLDNSLWIRSVRARDPPRSIIVSKSNIQTKIWYPTLYCILLEMWTAN